MNKFFDSKFKKDIISIGPGEYHISSEDIIIQTVLGSCVSVCLFSDYNNFAGMNHFMLPGDISKSKIGESDAGRYGMFSMEILINSLLKKGIKRETLKAKVFGGGNVIHVNDFKSNIGSNNVDFVLEYLENEKIPIISSHLRENYARKIIFFVRSHEVLLKKIEKSTETVQQEIAYSKSIRKKEEEKPASNNIIFLD